MSGKAVYANTHTHRWYVKSAARTVGSLRDRLLLDSGSRRTSQERPRSTATSLTMLANDNDEGFRGGRSAGDRLRRSKREARR